MARPRQKSPDELMREIIWTRKEACRVLRVDPRTLNRFLCHPDPKKRLASFKIGNTVRFERQKLLEYFRTTGKLMDISGNRP